MTHVGSCFCGAVTLEAEGEPEAMGYCHCRSCRSWSGGPVNAFSLWKPENVRVVEGGRERVQIFEGLVIARNGAGVKASFTVRKLSFGVGVERVFPVHAPIISRIEVVRRGDVRRSKLYYLRDRVGKSARIKELRD